MRCICISAPVRCSCFCACAPVRSPLPATSTIADHHLPVSEHISFRFSSQFQLKKLQFAVCTSQSACALLIRIPSFIELICGVSAFQRMCAAHASAPVRLCACARSTSSNFHNSSSPASSFITYSFRFSSQFQLKGLQFAVCTS